MRGWLAVLNRAKEITRQVEIYQRINKTLRGYCGRSVLDFDERAATEYQRIRKSRPRLATMDLKIAAIALANDALLLTRNTNDFLQVPGLKIDDWSK